MATPLTQSALGCPKLSLILATAGQALSPTRRRNVGVRLVIGMTGRTMRLARVDRRRRHASKRVLTMRYQGKMPRVAAHPVTAQMVTFQTLGDSAVHQLPDDTMGTQHSTRRGFGTEHPIPRRVRSALPRPTGIRRAFGDVTPDPHFERNGLRWH